jgi:hypothetical protein
MFIVSVGFERVLLALTFIFKFEYPVVGMLLKVTDAALVCKTVELNKT